MSILDSYGVAFLHLQNMEDMKYNSTRKAPEINNNGIIF